MALDEVLLDAVVAGGDPGGPLIRLYRWSRPTLSLGYHQRRIEPHWCQLAREGTIDLVRRPSGGRAVLHAGDLTYALIWPSPGLPRLEAYRQACAWLQRAFANLDQPLAFGDHRPAVASTNCFALATAADLVHRDGSKRIGSAQLWRRGHLLQHGSIQLEPPVALWEQLFGSPPPALAPLPVGDGELVERLAAAAAACWASVRSTAGVSSAAACSGVRVARFASARAL
jgi:lipoate-protein ligase A